MFVTVIGTGYVGTVTGACLAYLGHYVTCVDTDAAKIAKLERGEAPIYEPHLESLLAAAADRLRFTTVLADAVRTSDVIFIAVGTPPMPGGEADLSQVEGAARAVGAAMDGSRFRVVVNKSTVPVGCGNLVEALLREGVAEKRRESGEPIRFGVASNPEFLREGSAAADSLYPDRIVIGTSDERTGAMLRELYAPIAHQAFEPPAGLPRPEGYRAAPLVVTSLTSAEMIKYAANAFLATKIGFANEIANICERVGADILEVIKGVGLDSRIGSKFLNAGLGWGGSCFGKDVRALLHTAREYGYSGKLLHAAYEVNYDQRQIVIQKLQERLNILKGRTIGLLGLAFKPDTDDLRDAPSIYLAGRLQQMGARVRAYDPVAMPACRQQHPELNIQYCDSVNEVAAGADALVLITEWREFLSLDLTALARKMGSPVLIDGRNVFSCEDAAKAGFEYSGIGRRQIRAAVLAV